MGGEQSKNGCSIVIDPFGDVVAECRSMEYEIKSCAV
jgi:hypothetical protein